ncbi:hypothetical protein F53441_12047 [Fusarium austroafricanum]|uniref:Uncharacterized protein n=1 Tax=Fusarium austroafricanum TaxID=2364996 RepID=A0A8H4JYK1_9HYPO|nr:hypothetical protein F53441_12047 [Fusarium austroafricanum]
MVRTRAADRRNDASSRRNPSQPSYTHSTQLSTRPQRSHKASIRYNESSGDEGSDSSLSSLHDEAESESDEGEETRLESRSRRTNKTRTAGSVVAPARNGGRRSARQAAMSQAEVDPEPAALVAATEGRPALRRQTKKRTKPSQSKRRSLKKRRISVEADEAIPQGVIPDWTDPQIPYAAWTDIFYYAAMAGDDLDVNWLINTATTCKAFSEAALTAIYRSPPLVTTGKAKRFATLLDRPPSETRFNYRVKIETLYVDVHVLPQALLPRVIHLLPRLKEVILFTQSDQPPYRQLDQTVRWQYTQEIFHALRPSSEQPDQIHVEEKTFYTALKSWEWSGSLLGGPVATMNDVTRIHQEPSFTHLTKLSFTNLQVPSLYKLGPKGGNEERELELYNEDGVFIESIAEAISQLKSLQHLMFESSTAMNDRLLPLLPMDLTHLSLINCWEVKSDEFMPFLHSHGRHLRSLNLSHNQSLDMVFLTTLAATCPNLEELYMNLSYFRHHDSRSFLNNDADPLYDQVLLPHQKPEWPSSLRVIDFEHVRHWSVETAEMFLESLIDNAGSLPNLRYLAVKTMLNIPWKARANMRHEWRRKLDRVFLRAYEPPQRHYSLRQAQEEETPQVPDRKMKSTRLSDGPSRRSSRLAAHSDSDSRHSTNSKGLRSSLGRPTYTEPETDDNEFDSDSDDGQSPASSQEEAKGEGSDPNATKPVHLTIQGRCTTVSIVFDNQKPTELQYGMDDFMDDDRAESDDEWDGDHEEEDDGVFVWR